MNATIKFKPARIQKTFEFKNYVLLVNDIYEYLANYPSSNTALNNELAKWYEVACEYQPSLIDLDYFDFSDLKLTEESAKAFLKKRCDANGKYGLQCEIY